MVLAGILQLRFLKDMHVRVGEFKDDRVTSFCSLPEQLSQLSGLTRLSLVRYHDNVDTQALLHLTSLVHLHLGENPIRDRGADWVYHMPASVTHLKVTGDISMVAGRAAYPRASPMRGVPCITGLRQLERVSFQYLIGFRESEWDRRSCLAGLSRLRGLEISACGLRKFPEAILDLSSLRSLCLGNNELKDLPVGEYLKHLEELILADNKFSSVPVDALTAATALTRLTMPGNPLVWNAAQAEAVKRLDNF
jgi:Leucine-rich repeat (LRR) protein